MAIIKLATAICSLFVKFYPDICVVDFVNVNVEAFLFNTDKKLFYMRQTSDLKVAVFFLLQYFLLLMITATSPPLPVSSNSCYPANQLVNAVVVVGHPAKEVFSFFKYFCSALRRLFSKGFVWRKLKCLTIQSER